MNIELKGPNIHRRYKLEGLEHIPDCCFMRDDNGLPMVFLLTPDEFNHRLLYVQVHSVLQMELLKEFQA